MAKTHSDQKQEEIAPNDVSALPTLEVLFHEINRVHFAGELRPCTLAWNSRLQSVAGRFRPGDRSQLYRHPPLIEMATYLREQPHAFHRIVDTLGHEMIHYYLWSQQKPYGHTWEFLEHMKRMGVSRYNEHPKPRNLRYVYACQRCERRYPSSILLRARACRACCDDYAQGHYDERFRLVRQTRD